MINQKESCTSRKHLLSKYLMGGVAAGVLALSPFAAQAQDTTMAAPAPMADNAMSADPMLVTGTVENYWVDRAGFVSAMSVTTTGGVQTIRFSPTKAQTLNTNFPVGAPINVWVTPHMMGGDAVGGVWEARGLGTERPAVWMPVNMTSDFDWLSSTPYVYPGASTREYSGELRGVVTDPKGEVLALALDTNNGRALVRVPAELRQISRGHIGSNRVAQLIKGADVVVSGTSEAARVGLISTYAQRIAANTISINGQNAGSIGIQMLPMKQRRSLLGFDIGGMMGNNDMKDRNAASMGYTVYNASDMAMPMEDGSMSMGDSTVKTSATTTATGRVMIVTADGTMLPVVKQSGKVWVRMADGSMGELKKNDGKYTVPASLTGSRMMMVMSDGAKMEMDTVDGQMMVVMADGSMAPVTLHTP